MRGWSLAIHIIIVASDQSQAQKRSSGGNAWLDITMHINLRVSGQSQAQKRSSGGNAGLDINNTHQFKNQWPITGPEPYNRSEHIGSTLSK